MRFVRLTGTGYREVNDLLRGSGCNQSWQAGAQGMGNCAGATQPHRPSTASSESERIVCTWNLDRIWMRIEVAGTTGTYVMANGSLAEIWDDLVKIGEARETQSTNPLYDRNRRSTAEASFNRIWQKTDSLTRSRRKPYRECFEADRQSRPR